MRNNKTIDLTAPEFANNQQAKELIELRQRIAALDEFFIQTSLARNCRLKGCIEKCYRAIERMEQLHTSTTTEENTKDDTTSKPQKAITQTAILDVDSLSPEQMRAIIRHFLQEQRLCSLLKAGGSAI